MLQDVSFDDLQALVQFIYHGEVNVHQKNLTSFLKTAEVLKVSGLTQQPTSDTFNDVIFAFFAFIFVIIITHCWGFFLPVF